MIRILTFFILLQTGISADINFIRKQYSSINNLLKESSTSSREVFGVSTEGGELKGFYNDQGELIKLGKRKEGEGKRACCRSERRGGLVLTLQLTHKIFGIFNNTF